uniref:Uncharacterized protein n=1 Tax=Rhizophora mucronata TaxID=61149 RepID=A0A2P2ILY1_RHIMU
MFDSKMKGPAFFGSSCISFLAATSAKSNFLCVLHAPNKAPQTIASASTGIFSIKSIASSSLPARPRRSTMQA